MVKELRELLIQVKDDETRASLDEALTKLEQGLHFGLHFRDHPTEAVKLKEHPILSGSRVQLRVQGETATGTVVSVREEVAVVEWDDADTETLPKKELVVVAGVNDSIFPGLHPLSSIKRGGDKPAHVIIKAENYHALRALDFTHREAVDVIYIDPPYNLGGDLTYNDKRVAKDDPFRHSKWLSFMDVRLRLARNLLRETGVIIVAIDDTEQAHLRMLMDQVFGEQNFIATVVWQGGRKNDSKYVSVGHDYMLIYAKNEHLLKEAGVRWKGRKLGVDELMMAAQECWNQSAPDSDAATQLLNEWWKEQKAGFAPGLSNYNNIDENGRVYSRGDLSWPGGGGPKYEVLHPSTGKPCKIPSRGWVYSSPERMQEMIDTGHISFGPTHTTVPRLKQYLDELTDEVAMSVFDVSRQGAEQHLTKVLGEKRFTFPKDVNVLARWIDLTSGGNKDAVVLDFFGGSGSTAEAVMQLNAADGGRRQCILITNNEVDQKRAQQLTKDGFLPGDPEWERWGIFEHVTQPRLETVATGIRQDGSKYSDGLNENVEFFELEYLDPDQVELGNAFKEIAHLLWLKAGAVGPAITDVELPYAYPEAASYAVLFETSVTNARLLAQELKARGEGTHVFIVTDNKTEHNKALKEFPQGTTTTHLYKNYLYKFDSQRRW